MYLDEATGYTFVADVRPSYDFLYVQNSTEDIRLVFEHYLSETGFKFDYMNLIKTKPKNKEGNRLTVIIAVLVIGGFVVLGYIYWKRRKQEEESQQGGYFRASERDIPLVVLKE